MISNTLLMVLGVIGLLGSFFYGNERNWNGSLACLFVALLCAATLAYRLLPTL